MSPSDDSGQATTGRAPHSSRSGDIPPVVWTLLIGAGLFFGGLITIDIGVYTTRLLFDVGFLILALSPFIMAVIPAVLTLVAHPWASVGMRPYQQVFNHPRLVALTQIWAGVLIPGYIAVLVLILGHTPLWPSMYAVFLAGVRPFLALWLFDRRR